MLFYQAQTSLNTKQYNNGVENADAIMIRGSVSMLQTNGYLQVCSSGWEYTKQNQSIGCDLGDVSRPFHAQCIQWCRQMQHTKTLRTNLGHNLPSLASKKLVQKESQHKQAVIKCTACFATQRAHGCTHHSPLHLFTFYAVSLELHFILENFGKYQFYSFINTDFTLYG